MSKATDIMDKLTFPIVGIRHHDYSNRLEQLYETALGRSVILTIEEENVETNAIRAVLGGKHLGYVRTAERAQAFDCVSRADNKYLLAHITGVNQDRREIWVTVDNIPDGSPSTEYAANAFVDWHYDGPLLPIDDNLQNLKGAIDTFHILINTRCDWNGDMEDCVNEIITSAWMDISIDTRNKLNEILGVLQKNSHIPQYSQAANKIQITIDNIGSPEVRRYQVAHIMNASASEKVRLILNDKAETIKAAIQSIPEGIVDLFMNNSEECIARLTYLRLPFKTIRAIETLLALHIALSKQTTKSNDAIPSNIYPNHTFHLSDQSNVTYVGNVIISNSNLHIDKPSDIVTIQKDHKELTTIQNQPNQNTQEQIQQHEEEPCVILPPCLATQRALELWRIAQSSAWIDSNYQPLISKPKAALLADHMSRKLDLSERWSPFSKLWNIPNLSKEFDRGNSSQEGGLFIENLIKLM